MRNSSKQSANRLEREGAMNKLAILNTKFSFFDAPLTNVVPSRELSIEQIVPILRKDAGLSLMTSNLRANAVDKTAYANLKKSRFPYATFSGTFVKRNRTDLIVHSGLICIDLDHLGKDLAVVKRKVEEDLDHVILSFVSPGGDGLKIVYPINIEVAVHEKWVRVYEEHLREITGNRSLKVDRQCRDVARACLIPHDSLAFLNPHLAPDEPFDVHPVDYVELEEDFQTSYESDESWPHTTPATGLDLPPVVGSLDFSKINSEDNFLRLCQMTAKHAGKYSRPRNPWIQKLASRCNMFGMDQQFCEQSVVKYFQNLPASCDEADPLSIKDHFLSPIRSTYANYRKSHGTWTSLETNTLEAPELPNATYSKLPELFQDGCRLFSEAHERDLFFLGLLGVVSACMPNIRGRYAGWLLEANLFLMIVAPAASGKANLKWSFNAIRDILLRSEEEFAKDESEYQELIHADGPKPKKPIRKSIWIPGNSSSPAVIQALHENSGRGLIFETEADTIANTMQNDWGNYSDIVRRAFHHEHLGLRRRHENEQYSLNYPCLSMVVSGTPDQVRSLLQSTENGFFSRILFYDFKSELKWKSPFSGYNNPVFLDYMESTLPKTIAVLHDRCQNADGIKFTLTQHQQQCFDTTFQQWLLESEYMIGEESVATIKRLGVIQFRIAMILTAVRNLESLSNGKILLCNDDDFETALSVVDSLRLHAFKLIAGMKRKNRGFKGFSNNQQKSYYLYLPNEFSRGEANNRAVAIRLNLKTAEKYLEDYRHSGLLEHVRHGEYKKTNIGLQVGA